MSLTREGFNALDRQQRDEYRREADALQRALDLAKRTIVDELWATKGPEYVRNLLRAINTEANRQ